MIARTPIRYLGKKSKYLHLFDELLPLLPFEAMPLFDLTSGSATVALYFREYAGTTSMVLNDISEYPHLVASAFFDGPRVTQERLADGFDFDSVRGWASVSHSKDFTRETAAWVDGYCEANADSPLLLVALACVLVQGRFPSLDRVRLSALTPDTIAAEVRAVARRLMRRQHDDVDLTHKRWDYLNLPSYADEMGGYAVYLDPAWPTQPDDKTISNERAYGLYASTLMSILRQEFVDVPPEYTVDEDKFYELMAQTIERMGKKNTVFVAYQTVPEHVEFIKEKLFPGRKVKMAESAKNMSSTLREYLFMEER